MLGLAFAEAHRTQVIESRLRSEVSYSKASVGAALLGDDALGAESSTSAHHRRRRRRRVKKVSPPGARSGGGGGGHDSTGSRGSGSGRGGSLSSGSTNSYPKTDNNNRSNNRGGSSGPAVSTPNRNSTQHAKQHDAPMTKRDLYFSLRCGMVSTGPGGEGSAVGRVAIVNWDNQIVLDTFVKVPREHVFDYRTEETGITAELLDMTSSLRFETARTKVGKLIRGKILIGHGLEVDLGALGLVHPWSDLRDTATYEPYMKQMGGDPLVGSSSSNSMMFVPRPLCELMSFALGRGLNPNQSLLVREAIGCLELYKCKRWEWEKQLVQITQQKERQREMVLKMRSTGPQLSSIKEDAEVAAIGASGVLGSVTSSGHHVLLDDYEYEKYDDSTIATEPTICSTATTEPTRYSSIQFGQYYVDSSVDDHSDTHSLFTRDTNPELNVSLIKLDGFINNNPALIENLSQLDAFQVAGLQELQHQPYTALGSSIAIGTVPGETNQASPWSHESDGSDREPEFEMSGGGIWTAPLVLASNGHSSVGSGTWSHSSPPPMHATRSLPSRATGGKEALLETEEEALKHLPSQLLADLEEQEIMMVPLVSSDRSYDEKKRGWFGRERGGGLGFLGGNTADRSSRRDKLKTSQRGSSSRTARTWYSESAYGAANEQQQRTPRRQEQHVVPPPGFF